MMELVIFWCPIIGSILVGIAGCVWYGGSKQIAKWIAVAGVLLLLVTGAIQLLQYGFPPSAFRVEDVAGLFAGDSGNLVWHVPLQSTIGKIRNARYLSVTKLQPLATSVESYRLEGAPEKRGPWTVINMAPTWAYVFWAHDRAHALPFDMHACGLNFELIKRSINSGDTVSGWIWVTDSQWPKFVRMLLHTSKGDTFTISVVRPNVGTSDVSIQGAELKPMNKTVDLSAMPYSN
jgi:hypothetical protein